MIAAFTKATTAAQRYSVSLLCALTALLLHRLLAPIAGNRFPFLFFIPLLMVAASIAGRGPGMVVVACALLNAMSMLAPPGSLWVTSWRDQAMLVVFAIFGSVLVHLASRYRLMERRAANVEQRLALAQDAVGVGLFELEWSSQTILLSAALWSLLGLPPRSSPIPVEEWRRPIHPDDLRTCLELMSNAVTTGLVNYECEFRIHHALSGQSRWLLSRVHIERDAWGGVLRLRGATIDITQRKQLEAALIEADRRKDEFLAILAHELRNPLAPIRQAAALFRTASATDAQRTWSCEVIDRQVESMSLLLDDLLDVSRITRGTLQLRCAPIELREAIDSAAESVHALCEARQHRLTVSLPPTSVRLNADGLRLGQVFTNLLANAAKFTSPGGLIRLSAAAEADGVVIRIRDNGAGLSPEDMPRIFQMFVRGTAPSGPSDKGLGIGLALSKGIVELHGGSIEVHSDGPGRGSEFVVRLPLDPAMQELKAAAPASAAVPVAGQVSRRILIVDDNRDAADSLAAVLRIYGHEVVACYDGEEGLGVIGSFRPELAVLDIGLPGLSGHELAQRIRASALEHRITLIASTGWGQEQDRRRSQIAGFDHHLTKPVDLEQLMGIIAAAAPA